MKAKINNTPNGRDSEQKPISIEALSALVQQLQKEFGVNEPSEFIEVEEYPLPESKIMKNVELLLSYNDYPSDKSRKHLRMNGTKPWVYELSNCEFDSRKLLNFIGAVSYLRKHNVNSLILKLHKVKFRDKLVMSILECICYYLIEHLKINVYFKIKIGKTIITDGIQFSAFAAKNPDQVKNYFVGGTGGNHFRRVICYETHSTTTLSEVGSDLVTFLLKCGIDEDTVGDFGEALSEVIVNAIEHGKSDCFIDVDITEPDFIDKKDESKIFSINAVIFNLSDIFFHTKLKKKIDSTESWDMQNEEQYLKILEAREFHKKTADNPEEDYSIDDFYTLASFQKGISGDIRKEGLGGFGLFEIIKKISENSKQELCYMLSEDRVVMFNTEYIKQGEDGLIGFNKEHNFMTALPDPVVLPKSDTYFPGVAYNFSFVREKKGF